MSKGIISAEEPNRAVDSGPYTYYVITLGELVGGPGSLDDNDYALRGDGGKHQNDYKLHEDFCITDFQSS